MEILFKNDFLSHICRNFHPADSNIDEYCIALYRVEAEFAPFEIYKIVRLDIYLTKETDGISNKGKNKFTVRTLSPLIP
ncbi:MAG: hypothetical protein AVO38_11815 [delta proteobacterium ML8_D]|nr:MAG: hypothetical protein AVO38_11815 [delta proteobacterium ML8_D]